MSDTFPATVRKSGRSKILTIVKEIAQEYQVGEVVMVKLEKKKP